MRTDQPATPDAPGTNGAILFEALIVPHRSLSVRGRRRLMLALAALCASVGVRFWLIGAWPVIAFCALEVAGAIFLLHLNGRRAHASELVLLSDQRLRVIRTTSGGKRSEIEMPSAWLNVVMEESAGRVPRLLLGQRGRLVEVGASLGEDAKRDLATALRDVLHQFRNPRFDNVNLR